MTREQVVTGFHRLGLVLMLLIAAPTVLGTAFALLQNPRSTSDSLLFGAALLIGAGVIYIICRALAWIATGFMRE